MAVTDYIFQEETVEKRNFGAWLVAKMVAAGWQQVGSNPPTALNDPVSKFYVMKTKRDADNAEAYIGLQDFNFRNNTSSYSLVLNIELLNDYTPGTAGTAGTSTRTLSRMTVNPSNGIGTYGLAGINTAAYPLDTPLSIRFCITKTNVTLFVRLPSTYNLSGQMLFFGLPDFLQKEKVAGGSVCWGTGSAGAGNDGPIVCDSTPGTPANTIMSEATGRWLDPQKSPDAAGQFPLVPFFVGGTDTGMRHRMPSCFVLKTGGILDRDIIQVGGMNFEIMSAYSSLADVITNTFAYRIS